MRGLTQKSLSVFCSSLRTTMVATARQECSPSRSTNSSTHRATRSVWGTSTHRNEQVCMSLRSLSHSKSCLTWTRPPRITSVDTWHSTSQQSPERQPSRSSTSTLSKTTKISRTTSTSRRPSPRKKRSIVRPPAARNLSCSAYCGCRHIDRTTPVIKSTRMSPKLSPRRQV